MKSDSEKTGGSPWATGVGVETVAFGVFQRQRRGVHLAAGGQQDGVLEVLDGDPPLSERFADRRAEIEPALVAVVPGAELTGDRVTRWHR